MHPRRPRHHRLGRHVSEECRGQLALRSSDTAAALHRRARQGRAVRRRSCPATSRCPRPSAAPRPPPSRRRSAGSPRPTGRRSATSPTPTSVLDFLAHERASARWPRSAPPAPTTSCAPRSSRWCSTCPPTASVEDVDRPAARAARGLPRGLRGLLRPARHARLARRCAAPTRRSCSCPGVGMFSFGKDKQTARVAGEFYVNAINVMRGAEARLDLRPDRRGGEVPHRVLGARGGQAASGCRSPSRSPTRIALVTGAGSRHRQGHRRRGSPPRAPASSSPTSTLAKAAGGGRRDRRHRRRDRRRRPTSPTRTPSQAAVDAAVLAFGGVDLVVNNAGLSLSKPLLETTEADWDLQHDVMAKGSFLVSRGRRAGDDRPGHGRRHRLHLLEELRLRRPEQHRLRRRPRPTRPTRCGCSPPSSASTASGSTASTPTASCAAPASSPAAGAPSAPRSTACRRRTSASSTPSARCSSARCCPSTSPTPCSRSTGGDLTHTTGLHIPVDAGVAAAFLR